MTAVWFQRYISPNLLKVDRMFYKRNMQITGKKRTDALSNEVLYLTQKNERITLSEQNTCNPIISTEVQETFQTTTVWTK